MKKGFNISQKGYQHNSPDRHNPYNVIPSNRITMQGVPFPVLGVDNFGNMQMMMPGGEYIFPGNMVFEKPIMQTGGATRADSIAVLNNANALNAYYGNNKAYESLGAQPIVGNPFAAMNTVAETFKNRPNDYSSTIIVPTSKAGSYPGQVRTYTENSGTGNTGSERIIPDFGMYRKDINPNQFEQRELQANILDTRAPMGFYDTRIQPQGMNTYRNIGMSGTKEDPLYGDAATVMQYDPLAVTPWDMLDDAQRKQRVETYGTDGTPYADGTSVPEGWVVPEGTGKPKRITPDPNRSVVDNLNAMGEDSSFTARKDLFKEAGLDGDYKGTKEQNIALNKWLHDGKPTSEVLNDDITTDVDKPVIENKPIVSEAEQNNTVVKTDVVPPLDPVDVKDKIIKTPIGPEKIIKQKPGAWYKDEDGNLKQWYPKDSEDYRPPGQEVILSNQKYGGSTMNYGAQSVPALNMGKVFKQHAKLRKKKYGGKTEAPQNAGTQDITTFRNDMMKNYLSQNAMENIAVQEAEQLANTFLQYGGVPGFNPNMYNQSQYAMASQNPMQQDLGNLFASTFDAFATANPYTKTKIKMQAGGQTGQAKKDAVFWEWYTSGSEVPFDKYYADYQYNSQPQAWRDDDWLEPDGYNDPNGFVTTGREPWQPQTGGSGSTWIPQGPIYDENGNMIANPGANAEWSEQLQWDPNRRGQNPYAFDGNNTGGSGSTWGGGSSNAPRKGGAGSTWVPNNQTPSTGGGSGSNTGGGNRTTPVVDFNSNPNNPASSNNQQSSPSGPRTGNYQGDPNANNVNQGNQNVYGFYGLDPMAFGKVRGQHQGFQANQFGAPGIFYDPNNTTIDINEKGRLFGPGIRKRKITFTPGANGQPIANVDPNTGQPNQAFDSMGNPYATPNVGKEEFIERHIDPNLMSKKQHGDISPEEQAQWQAQYDQYANQYDTDRARQVGPVTSGGTKKTFRTKLKNFMQERNAVKDNRRNKRDERRGNNSTFVSGVHPDYDPTKGNMTNQRYGGPMYLQVGGPIGVPTTGAYPVIDKPVTIIEKNKMGINPEAGLNWANAGVNTIAGMFEAAEARKNEEIMRQRMNADALYQPIGFGNASRGDYETNMGAFRPDDHVPVQFRGNNFGSVGAPQYKMGGGYESGGEYYMTDAEIAQIKAMGGSIEYID